MRFVIATLAFTMTIVQYAGAAESASASSMKAGSLLGNKKFEEDKRITDNELKAQAGSLSQWSMKFDLSYQGPPVDNLSDPEMPNPDNRPRNNRTSLSGYMGGRYRVNSNEAWNLSTGLRWYSPYHQVAGEHVDKPKGQKDQELANPQVGYDLTKPWGAAQMRTSIKTSVTTQDYYTDRGQVGSFGIGESVKYTIADSRWIVSGIADLDFYFFNREYRRGDGRLSNYNINLIPGLEYKISDKLNVRTSAAYSWGNLRMKGSWWKWEDQMVSQRLGVGWAVTRSIYFNPYLNFFPERPAIRTTSLSFSTVFSIF
jgi:hypothetical protein